MTEQGPYAAYRSTVSEDAIDYNGHMNDAEYARVLTDANELFLDALGLSASYRDATGCGLYTVEMHIRFLREVSLGDELRAETWLASYDTKRVRLRTTVLAADGSVVAEGETLYLHVDAVTGAVAPIPDDRAAVLASTLTAHAAPPDARDSSARS